MDNTDIHPENHDETFNYMFLDRLRMDCKYYIGHGNRRKDVLWARDERKQISLMKEFFSYFKGDKVPQWISMKDIENFEKQMIK